jgi:hypothetical protein
VKSVGIFQVGTGFPCHRLAVGVPWAKRMGYAYWYVCSASRAVAVLDEWVEQVRLDDLSGVTRDDLRDALKWARKWKPPEFFEGRRPPAPTPDKLFGRKGVAG